MSRQFGETLVMIQDLVGLFTKLRKAHVSLVMSVLPLPRNGFS